MHSEHDVFLQAVDSSRKVKLTFSSSKGGDNMVITCSPLDYHPCRRASDKSDFYFFGCSDTELYCFEIDKNHHILKLAGDQVVRMELTDEKSDAGHFKDIHSFLRRKRGLFEKAGVFIRQTLGRLGARNTQGPADRRSDYNG
ncbi:MAG TPA: hypothetical protein VMW23_01405 [Sedimentisphaerales bacterium]|nr:hypothetical protein [Sedimentisphaerales bacterium]